MACSFLCQPELHPRPPARQLLSFSGYPCVEHFKCSCLLRCSEELHVLPLPDPGSKRKTSLCRQGKTPPSPQNAIRALSCTGSFSQHHLWLPSFPTCRVPLQSGSLPPPDPWVREPGDDSFVVLGYIPSSWHIADAQHASKK